MIEQKLQKIGLPVFSISGVQMFLGATRQYARTIVHRLSKKGVLAKLGAGKYCLRGTDPYAVASNLASPSYVSFLSALSFHGATTQLPSKITVACAKNRKSIEYEGTEIEFVKISPKKQFGFRRARTANGYAFLADLEKAIIDCAYLPRHGSISEAFGAMKNGAADLEKLANYALEMKSGTVLKRIGFLLEKIGVDKSKDWKGKISRKYDLLDPQFPAKGEKNKKWKLIANRVL